MIDAADRRIWTAWHTVRGAIRDAIARLAVSGSHQALATARQMGLLER